MSASNLVWRLIWRRKKSKISPLTLILKSIMLIAIALLVAGLVALVVGGELLVRGAVEVGHWFHLSNMVIGLTIVAFGTSAPELAVSVGAALSGVSELAIANVVGSNLANIALVLAFTALLKPVAIESLSLKRDMPFMLIAFVAIVVVLADTGITRMEGLAMVLALVAYLFFIIRHAKRNRLSRGEESEKQLAVILTILSLIGGVVLLSLGGHWLVKGATALATFLGVSEAVIGLTIVAVGTSLPEIATSVIALVRGHGAIAIGNIVGSNIWNTFGVLGLTALITRLDRGQVSWHMVAMMCLAGLVLWIFSRTQHQINRYEGGIMLGVYATYQWWLFASQMRF